MKTQLSVYLNTIKVGTLTRDGRRLSFSYTSGYLISPKAYPISRHLPLAATVFDDEMTKAFFANLLPEGAVLTQVARQIGISQENVFGLLEAIGGDCAGAISVISSDSLPEQSCCYRPVSEIDLSDELDNLPIHPFLAGEEGVRLSLAGAQNKLPIFFDGNSYFIPEGTSPSSHILKTAIFQLDNTVINEAYCMMLAARIGLPVPHTQVVTIGGQQVYMVDRYDRTKNATGNIVRLHQEDFCQALGISPELKYEKEGGPGFSDCFRLVDEWSSEPLLDAKNLLNWSLYNFIIGNADAHGKNLSFLYISGQVRVAPFYDLISTSVYKRLNSRFAMKMGGQIDPRYLSPNSLKHFAAEIGINIRTVRSAFTALMDIVEAKMPLIVDEFRDEPGAPAIMDDIAQVISQRIAKGRSLVQ
jgi:serine/threonine-protein kinase HipA